MICLQLPFPPSVNHMYVYGRRPGQHFLAKSVRAFREEVAYEVIQAKVREPLSGPLRVAVHLYSDKPHYDIDNCLKALLDALESAGVFHDDAQIKSLVVEDMNQPGGCCHVYVDEHTQWAEGPTPVPEGDGPFLRKQAN